MAIIIFHFFICQSLFYFLADFFSSGYAVVKEICDFVNMCVQGTIIIDELNQLSNQRFS